MRAKKTLPKRKLVQRKAMEPPPPPEPAILDERFTVQLAQEISGVGPDLIVRNNGDGTFLVLDAGGKPTRVVTEEILSREYLFVNNIPQGLAHPEKARVR